MKREFLLNIAFLLAINLVIKPLYLFGIDRSVQNMADQGAYGFYFELFNFTFLFQIINDLGLQTYNNRFIAQYPNLVGKYLSSLLSLKLWLGLIFALAVLLAGYFAGYLSEFPELLLGMAAIQFMNSMILFLRSNISGLGWYFTDSLLSVLDRTLLILVLGIPLMLGWWAEGGFSIMWFVYAQLGAMSVTIFTASVLLWKASGGMRIRWQPVQHLALLRKAYPYALAIALMSIYTRIDGVMIGRLLSDGKIQADWYASAYRLLDALNMIGFLFATLLLPMFSRMHADRNALKGLADLGIKLIWSGAMTVVPAILLFRVPLMELLYANGNAYSGDILGWLIACFIPIGGGYIFGTLLLAIGKQGWLNRFYALGIPVNIALNLFLLPVFKAEGAAIATLGTQLFIFFALLYSSKRWLGFGISPGIWLRSLLLLAVSAAMAWTAREFLFREFGWWTFLSVLGLGLLTASALRLLDWRELLLLMKNREAQAANSGEKASL